MPLAWCDRRPRASPSRSLVDARKEQRHRRLTRATSARRSALAASARRRRRSPRAMRAAAQARPLGRRAPGQRCRPLTRAAPGPRAARCWPRPFDAKAARLVQCPGAGRPGRLVDVAPSPCRPQLAQRRAGRVAGCWACPLDGEAARLVRSMVTRQAGPPHGATRAGSSGIAGSRGAVSSLPLDARCASLAPRPLAWSIDGRARPSRSLVDVRGRQRNRRPHAGRVGPVDRRALRQPGAVAARLMRSTLGTIMRTASRSVATDPGREPGARPACAMPSLVRGHAGN